MHPCERLFECQPVMNTPHGPWLNEWWVDFTHLSKKHFLNIKLTMVHVAGCFDWTEYINTQGAICPPTTTGHTFRALLLHSGRDLWLSNGQYCKKKNCGLLCLPCGVCSDDTVCALMHSVGLSSCGEKKKSVKHSERYLSRPQAHESRLAGVILSLMWLISCFTAYSLVSWY